ncbi:MAG: alanine racemase, partial [Hyphomicrobiaceae bacterium]
SVKANAYGHGIVAVGQRLQALGVEVLATGSFSDAIAMREAGITAPILMMAGALPSAIPELLRHDLIATVHNRELGEAVGASATKTAPIYVKVDCGFGRLGVPLEEAQKFILDLARMPKLEIAGIYTHLPFSNEAGREWARDGIAKFDGLIAGLTRQGLAVPMTQARASAALLAGIEDSCTAVSPGAFLYGLSPLDPGLADTAALRPVMKRIQTQLIQVSPNASPSVGGYGRLANGILGVVPFGRVDGNRAPIDGSGAHMLVNGIEAPVLGVSLEHAVLDLSAVPQPAVGDTVTLLGRCGDGAIALEDIARWQGVGVNDVLMAFNDRIAQAIC